jgi:hypothetical protein
MRPVVAVFSLLAGLFTPFCVDAQPAASPAPTAAAALPAASPQPGSLEFTGPELARVFQALADIQTSPDILVSIASKPVNEMPSYDPICHYAGIMTEAKGKVANVWCVSPSAATDVRREALAGALLLAVMDYGFAGPKWKATYDLLAAKDAALPASETNRYLNRLTLEQQLLKIFDEYSHKPKS